MSKVINENSKLNLEEIEAAYLNLEVKITKLWNKEVGSKVELGETIWKVETTRNNYDGGDMEMEVEKYNAFIKSLPFESSSYKKYMNIGKNKSFLLEDIGKDNLPNDYNILYTITSDKVMNNPSAKAEIIKNLKPTSSRDDVSKMISPPKEGEDDDNTIVTDCVLAKISVNSKSFDKESFNALIAKINNLEVKGADIKVEISSANITKINKNIADKYMSA